MGIFAELLDSVSSNALILKNVSATSPFAKGGLRGIYLIKSPLTPLFKRGGQLLTLTIILTKKNTRQLAAVPASSNT